MQEDILLSHFFDPEGLEAAIDKAVDKDIKRTKTEFPSHIEQL